jgi:hypothetical protein
VETEISLDVKKKKQHQFFCLQDVFWVCCLHLPWTVAFTCPENKIKLGKKYI